MANADDDPVLRAGRAHLERQRQEARLKEERQRYEAERQRRVRAEEEHRQVEAARIETRERVFARNYVGWLRRNRLGPDRRIGWLWEAAWPFATGKIVIGWSSAGYYDGEHNVPAAPRSRTTRTLTSM
jgi:hypothetical protein